MYVKNTFLSSKVAFKTDVSEYLCCIMYKNVLVAYSKLTNKNTSLITISDYFLELFRTCNVASLATPKIAERTSR